MVVNDKMKLPYRDDVRKNDWRMKNNMIGEGQSKVKSICNYG